MQPCRSNKSSYHNLYSVNIGLFRAYYGAVLQGKVAGLRRVAVLTALASSLNEMTRCMGFQGAVNESERQPLAAFDSLTTWLGS